MDLMDSPVMVSFLNPRSSLEFTLFLGTTNFLKLQPDLYLCLRNIYLFVCESTYNVLTHHTNKQLLISFLNWGLSAKTVSKPHTTFSRSWPDSSCTTL